jgi:protein TonB
MALRVSISIALGTITAFGLFWVMQALVSVSGELKEGGRNLSIDYVRLKRDNTPETKKREPPKREKPQQQPPPPDMNVAKAMRPGDAVSGIVPMLDTSMELEKATSLGAGGGDRDVVPLVRVDPDYPPRARQRGIEGFVDVEFSISPVGTVQNPKVIGANPTFVFDRAALRAIRKWKYNPKIENGVAVTRHGIQVRIRFELERGR